MYKIHRLEFVTYFKTTELWLERPPRSKSIRVWFPGSVIHRI